MSSQWLYPLFISALAYGVGGLLLCRKIAKDLAAEWLWSFFRSILQLGALGFVFILFIKTPAWKVVIPAVFLMMIFAVQALRSRNSTSYAGFYLDGAQVLGLLMLVVILPAVYFGVPSAERENVAQFLPWIGILLGNALSGISLGTQSLIQDLQKNAESIHTELAWGNSPEVIFNPIRKTSIKTAMTPILNSMTVAGVVNIPGVMTGQLIAGVSPLIAVQTQLAILMLVAVLVFSGVFLFHRLLLRRAFTPRAQLNTELWTHSETS